MSLMLKLNDLKPGEYSTELVLTNAYIAKLEHYIIEKLKQDKAIPENTWVLSTKVEVQISVKGTPEEIENTINPKPKDGWTIEKGKITQTELISKTLEDQISKQMNTLFSSEMDAEALAKINNPQEKEGK